MFCHLIIVYASLSSLPDRLFERCRRSLGIHLWRKTTARFCCEHFMFSHGWAEYTRRQLVASASTTVFSCSAGLLRFEGFLTCRFGKSFEIEFEWRPKALWHIRQHAVIRSGPQLLLKGLLRGTNMATCHGLFELYTKSDVYKVRKVDRTVPCGATVLHNPAGSNTGGGQWGSP